MDDLKNFWPVAKQLEKTALYVNILQYINIL